LIGTDGDRPDTDGDRKDTYGDRPDTYGDRPYTHGTDNTQTGTYISVDKYSRRQTQTGQIQAGTDRGGHRLSGTDTGKE